MNGPGVRTFLFILLLLAGPLAADPGPDDWSADLGWGPVLVPGNWTPLRLSVPATARDWSVDAVITIGGQDRTLATYSHSGGGSWEHPVFLPEGAPSLTLRFREPQAVREIRLPVAERGFPGHLVVVSGLDAEACRAIEGVLLPSEPVRTSEFPPSLWPSSPLCWQAVAAVAVTDPGPVLSPVQAQAVEAWLASGGRLVVVDPRPGSGTLVSQLGGMPVVTAHRPPPGFWKGALGLAAYGTVPRLGSAGDPPFAPPASPSRPDGPVAVGLVTVWGLLGAALALRKKRSLGPGLALALGGTLAVAGVALAGGLTWDRGVVTHTREVSLPGGRGRFVSVESSQPEGSHGASLWPETSPWALGRVLEGQTDPRFLSRETSARRIVRDAYLPPLERTSVFRVAWSGQALVWNPEPSPGLAEEAPWIARVAAARPGARWVVGVEGTTCWLRPEETGGLP